jgi:1,4-dihydroxy-2-naphthoate octaprenyltransferase
MINPWIHAARLRTLPLALSGSLLGSLLAAADGLFRLNIFLLAALTSLLLQVLSNLANDYGDFTKGTDNHERIGPDRMVSTGAITPRQMIAGIITVSLLTLASGIFLILEGFNSGDQLLKVIFLLLGLSAIGAAIKYTMGKNPYGYSGFGDIFVFLFFGLVAVIGTNFLHTQTLRPELLLPAASLGLLSTGVLNLNNLRDELSDLKSNKHTLVVKMGGKWGKVYHAVLLISAIVTASIYVILFYENWIQLLFLISLPFLLRNMVVVFRNKIPSELNVELRNLSLSTLLFSVTFGLGFVIRF